MWKLLPISLIIKVYIAVLTIIFFIVNLIPEWGLLKVVEVSGLVSLGIMFLLAKWGWKYIWKNKLIDLNKLICPDLNGNWEGNICSNYSDEIKKVKAKIEVDFLTFKMFLNSEDNYSESSVISSQLYRDTRTDIIYLYYMFEGQVPNPKKTDETSFDGAAKLKVKYENGSFQLEGTYWTNRGYQNNNNTAGRIELKKSNY